MESQLHQRWQEGKAPFDGVTLSPASPLPLPVLRQFLLAIIEFLEDETPEPPLYKDLDWHEHDGYVTEADRTSWADFKSWCASEEILYAHRSGDDYVHVGVFPKGRDWYLRFDINDEMEEGERVGDFDFTGPPGLVAKVQAAVERAGLAGLGCEPAKGYFDRRYAG
jgi:hypothetical protein